MHTCMEAGAHEGKVWTCRTDAYIAGKGAYKQSLIFLEGFSGSFLTDYLQLVKHPVSKQSREDSVAVISELIESGKLSGEEIIALQLAVIALSN